jgi:hypothetical protein
VMWGAPFLLASFELYKFLLCLNKAMVVMSVISSVEAIE